MARVSNRQNIVKLVTKSRVWNVAFYIRLSREDKRGRDESESITNQRLILTDFLEEQDDGDQYVFVGEYVERTLKNPFCFRYGNMGILTTFDDDAPPLEDVLTNFLIRKKSGL